MHSLTDILRICTDKAQSNSIDTDSIDSSSDITDSSSQTKYSWYSDSIVTLVVSSDITDSSSLQWQHFLW